MKNRKVTKKIHRLTVVFCLSVCLIFSAFLTPVPAVADTVANTSYPIDHNSPYYQKLAALPGLDADAFTQFLYGELFASEATISFRDNGFHFPRYYTEDGTEKQAIYLIRDWIYYDCPALFHVNTALGWTGTHRNNGVQCINTLNVTYLVTASEYQTRWQACEKSMGVLLRNIQGNNSLSDVNKALLLHDRLIIWCAYDRANLLADSLTADDYTMYGTLVNQTAVCQGYSWTYKYLLAMVGISSYICSSNDIVHAWNIVYIGGVPYHVDLTHDDPCDGYEPYDQAGRVYHNNFLVDDTRSRQLHAEVFGTNAYAYDTALTQIPTSAIYHNAYWKDLEKEIMLIDNELYYCEVDGSHSGECAVLKTVSGDIVEEFYYDCYLREVNGGEEEYWTDYPMPSSLYYGSYMGYFLYSQPDGIYGYRIADGSEWKFCSYPVANGVHQLDYFYVFGCMADGRITYDVYRTNLEYVPSTGLYSYTTPIVSTGRTTFPLFDVNQDHSFDVLDLVKAKKMAAAGQRRFIEGCGQMGNADSLVLLTQALLEY